MKFWELNFLKTLQIVKILQFLIFILFKKIVFGLGPRSKSYEYFRQKQASCFGIGIYYVETINQNLIKNLRVNIFSDVMQQDGEAVVRNLKFLRGQEFYKKIEDGKKKIMVFCDVG